MRNKAVIYCFALLLLLFLVSCGGGGGGNSSASANEAQGATDLDEETPPSDNDAPPTDESDEEPSDETYVAGPIPVPEVIPVPLNEGIPPILSCNIWSWQRDGRDYLLYLVDDAKLFQGEGEIFAETSSGTTSVSPNGQYVAFRDESSLDVVVYDLAKNLIGTGTHTSVLQYAWAPDSSKLLWENDEQIICMKIPSGSTSVVFQGDVGTVVRSVSVSPDGQYVTWVLYEEDFLISLFYAQLGADGTFGAPILIWEGLSSYENRQLYIQFIDDAQFVFLLAQPDNAGELEDCIFLADIESESVHRVFSHHLINHPVVSNSGNYIAYSTLSMVYMLDTNTWEFRPFDRFGDYVYVRNLAWSPSDEHFLVVANEQFYLYSLADLSSKWMLTKIEGTCWEIQWK